MIYIVIIILHKVKLFNFIYTLNKMFCVKILPHSYIIGIDIINYDLLKASGSTIENCRGVKILLIITVDFI